MGKFFTWFFALIFVGMLAYGGWGLFNTLVPAKAEALPLQAVKLAKGSLDAAVISTGQLRSAQSAQLAWGASGKVGTVKVKLGDKVKAGDVLATLDPTALPDNILLAEIDMVAARQALSDLVNTQATLPAAEKAVIDAQTAVDKAQNHRDGMSYPTRGNPQQIASANAQFLRADQSVKRARTIYERLPGSPTDNHAKAEGLTTLDSFKTNRDLALATVNWYKGPWKPDEIAAADSALTLAKARLADAKTALAKVQKGPDPKKLSSVQHRIDVDQAVLDTQNLIAPIDGVVTVLNDKPGDLINSGDVSLRTDDTSAFFIDLQMSEVDIARIREGQLSTVTFDAITGKNYEGKVTFVSPVGVTTNGVINFKVTLQVSNPDSSLRAGLTSAASIVVDTAQNVMLVPSKAIKALDGQKVVYVLSSVPVSTTPSAPATLAASGPIKAPIAGETETIVPVTVKTGVSSDTLTQIISSRLQVGDLIVLNPPADALTKNAVNGN
jgi:HlyD family secretion protein